MKFTNAKQIQDFLEAVNQCNSEVYLISPEGDRFNLKFDFQHFKMDYLQRYISVSNKAFFLSQSSNFIGL